MVEHSREVAAPLPAVWAFVRDMDNWAPLVTGYQRHEKLSDSESFWFLKGELGGLTRIAEFKVHIDEWDEAGRVLFSLRGVNEPVTGSGSFVATALDAMGETPTPPPARKSLWSRWWDAVVRSLLGAVFKSGPTAPAAALGSQKSRSRITFKLSLTASGAAGLVLNVMLTPMLKPVAENLADKIAAAVSHGEAPEAAI